MSKFVFLYYNGGDPAETPKEDMQGIMADWAAWYKELGAAIVDGGSPFSGNGMAVSQKSADAIEEWPSSGYTIIEASDMDAAVKIAQGHPMHKHTKGEAIIRVYESTPM